MNEHVHPLFRRLLNDFFEAQAAAARAAERSAELQAERLREWRADDAEAARDEREGKAA